MPPRVGSRKLSDRFPVYGLFIDPALGRVGMTEKEAVAKGLNVLTATRRMSQIGRAKEMGETLGFAKLLVDADADTDLILGAAILGPVEMRSSTCWPPSCTADCPAGATGSQCWCTRPYRN